MSRIANRDVPSHVGSDFVTHNQTLHGKRNPIFVNSGHLPQEWRDVLHSDDVAYVVYSYSTPIAFELSDGRRFVPDVKYSPTTSKHQGLVRNGWSNFATEVPA